MIWLLLACEPGELRAARCQAPLVELVTWRNDRYREWLAGRERLGAGEMLAFEREHVAAAVTRMRPDVGSCATTWRMSLWSTPDTPTARLRDEAVRQVLGLPTTGYSTVAVGLAGVTTDGRAGVLTEPTQPD
ncbi:MAG: hypothetical protein EXR71_11620 [Myxococcales bacterium]|nr:hypothetical protein [Myxococcales bacterium]